MNAQAGRLAGALRVAGLGVVCLLVIGGLYGAARGGRSAEGGSTVDRITHPPMTADAVCATWAGWWLRDSGLGTAPETLEGLTRCRETADGGWVVADGIGDPQLARAYDAGLAYDVALRRAQLVEQIASLDDRLAARTWSELFSIYVDAPTGVLGFVAEGRGSGSARANYERAMVAVLAGPDMVELRGYMAWSIARKQGAYGALLEQCSGEASAWLHYACAGLRWDLAIDAMPWPWDLAEPWSIEAYLIASAG